MFGRLLWVIPVLIAVDANGQESGRSMTSRPDPVAGLRVEFVAPTTIRVHQTARLRIRLHNEGADPIPAFDVEAEFPDHVRVTGSLPAPKVVGRSLHWKGIALEARQSRELLMDAISSEAKSLDVRVAAHPRLSGRFAQQVVDQRLSVMIQGPTEAVLGQMTRWTAVVRNDGSLPISSGGLSWRMSQGLQLSDEPTAPQSGYSLSPGQTIETPISLVPVQAGAQGIKAKADADGLTDETEFLLTVVRPLLAVDLTGPRQAPPGAQATYVLSITNSGDSQAEGVYGFVEAPEGMGYRSSEPAGQYDVEGRYVYWTIGSLPVGKTVRRTVVLDVQATGTFDVRGSARDSRAAEGEQSLITRASPTAPPIEPVRRPMAYRATSEQRAPSR